MTLLKLIEILDMNYSGDYTDYEFFMCLIDNSVAGKNPFENLKKDTVERGIRRGPLSKAKLRLVLKNKDVAKLVSFIKNGYSEVQTYAIECEIKKTIPSFNSEEAEFAYPCSDLFYCLVDQYINGDKDNSSLTRSSKTSEDDEGIVEAFATRYSKKMSISEISSSIRARIFDDINAILSLCQDFKNKTTILQFDIATLDTAKNEGNQALFIRNYPAFKEHCDDVQQMFYEILRQWGHLYTTFAHITEIKEISKLNFAHLYLTPDSTLIHKAGENTDSYMEKLKKLSEDYLFT